MRVTPIPIANADLERFVAAAATVLARDPQVLAAWLFGSAARGEPARDLDIALLLTVPADPWHLERLRAAIEADGQLGLDVDLRPVVGSTPRFRANVLREGRLIFDRSPHERIAFEAQAVSEWLDFKPAWERMRQAALEHWAR